MRWIDLSAHNAALWTLSGEGGERWLLLEAIDPDRGIEGLDEAFLKTLTDPPADEAPPSFESLFNASPQPADPNQGLGERLNAKLIHGRGGQLVGLRVDHPDPASDTRPGMGLSTWMRLAPKASIRDASTMLTGFPPIHELDSESSIRPQWLWAVPVADMPEANREALGLAGESSAAETLYVVNETDALRLSTNATAVKDAQLANRLTPIAGLSPTLYADGASPITAFNPAASETASAQDPTAADADGDTDADTDMERRDDYGEKIGGARKDLAGRAGINKTEWSKATDMAEVSVKLAFADANRGDPANAPAPTALAMTYSGEALRAARSAARKPKLKTLWPESAVAAMKADTAESPLKALTAEVVRSALPESTTAIRPTRARSPGSLVEWLLLAGGFSAHVNAVRERVEGINADEDIVDAINASIEEGKAYQYATLDSVKARVTSLAFEPKSASSERLAWIEKAEAHNQTALENLIANPLVRYGELAVDRESWVIGYGKSRSVREVTDQIGLSEDDGIAAKPSAGRFLADEDASIDVLNEAITCEIERFSGQARAEPLHRMAVSVGLTPVKEPSAFAKSVLKATGLVSDEGLEAVGKEAVEAFRAEKRNNDYRDEFAIRRQAEPVRELAKLNALAQATATLQAMIAEGTLTEHLDGLATDTDDEAPAADEKPTPTLESVIPKVETVKRPLPPRYKHLSRQGPERVEGHVSEAEVAETFGLRGIEYGHWVNQDERQAMIDMAYESFSDMAEALDLPRRAIGFDGELGLALGARGRGGKVAAHYEPARVVINLTKTMGAGTLAHEWSHALDHEIRRQQAARDGTVFASEAALRAAFGENNPTGRGAMGLMHYDPEADADDSPAAVAMRAFFKAMVVDEKAAPTDGRSGHLAQRGAVLRVRMAERLLKPAAIAEAVSAGDRGNKDDDGLTQKAIAAQWPERVRPFIDWLAGAATKENPARAVMDACCRGHNTYDRDRVFNTANQALQDAGGTPLSERERAIFDEWFKIKDLRFFIKQAQQYGRDPADMVTFTQGRPTQFYRDACFLERTTRKSVNADPYWNSGRELFARGFSTVIDQRMREAGITNDFASLYSRPGGFTAEAGYSASPNPEGEEPEVLVKAAESLLRVVRDFAPEPAADEAASAERPARPRPSTTTSPDMG